MAYKYYTNNEIAITEDMRKKYIDPRKDRMNFSDICAHCAYHDIDLTIKALKKKGCLCKENTGNTCKHLEKYDHEYWKVKENKKALKKLK